VGASQSRQTIQDTITSAPDTLNAELDSSLDTLAAKIRTRSSKRKAVEILAKAHKIDLKNVGKGEDGKVMPHTRTEQTTEQVMRYVACGASREEIAVMMNLRPGVLQKHYARELEIGLTQNNMKVAGTLLDMATSGEFETSTIYWTKARMGWRDKDTPGTQMVNPLQINIHI